MALAELQQAAPVAICPERAADSAAPQVRQLPQVPQLPRRVAAVLTALGLAMIPWLFVLHAGLPATAQASHWAWTWTGLDTLEAIGLLSTGLLLRRGDQRASLTAAATSTLLLIDAWFDTMTAAPGTDLATAELMAVLIELPLAAACAVLAVRTFPRFS